MKATICGFTMLRAWTVAVIILGCRIAETANVPPAPARYALLVGCTKYPNGPNIRELHGPLNDIPAFSKLLETKFGFRRENIRILVGWPDDAAARPARDNIAAAFQDLIAKAEEDSQVVVLISGHGTQVPDDSDEENDGRDEVFLPADVRPWSDNNLPNAIRDDDFGKWFDALRQKGAHVWAVFDCCHSGTMTRAASDVEQMRTVQPDELGIQFENKKERTGAVPERALDLAPASTKGSLTEFYAAQAFEEAPELPRPADAPRDPRNSYGLFTYTLVQALEQRRGALSYGDLSREIVNGYRSERGSKPPTPFFAGDLNREVLGLHFWPERADIVIQENKGKYHIDAGEINGITRGSILAVTVRNAPQAKAEVLGYVRVTDVTPTKSSIESCQHEDKPMVALDKFPKGALCRVVMCDIGDMRVKFALRTSPDPAAADLNQIADEALKKLPAEIQGLVDRVANEARADWLLDVVGPAEAEKKYQKKLDVPAVLLVKKSGDPGSQIKVWSTYSIEPSTAQKQVDTLSAQAANDLQKIFTWQNIWRVAGRAANSGESDLTLQVNRKNAPPGGASLPDPNIFQDGETISVAINNEGIDAWWITILHLDPNYKIVVWDEGSIEPRRPFKPFNLKINDKSLGPEGVVLLAAPTATQKQQPDYKSLAQTALGDHTRSRGTKGGPMNPFGRLMAGASLGKATRSAVEPDAPDQPQVFLRSWLTIPAVKK